MTNRWGNSGNGERLYFRRAPKSQQMVTAAMTLKDPCSLKKSYDQQRQHIKQQRHYFANQSPSSQGYGFSSGHVWMWELDCEELSAEELMLLNCSVGEDYWDLDCKEIQSVHPKGDQFWIFIGRTDADAETPIPWPPDGKNWLTWKDPDAGKDWRQEKGMAENEIVGWHHRLSGHESE